MSAVIQQLIAQSQAQQQQGLANAARQPIPGFTGPAGTGAGIPTGMAPPQQPLPGPTMGNHMFTPQGPYAQQAMQMAGLLGGGAPMQNPAGNIQTQQGLLGGSPKGFRVPFYRPVGK